jgi:DNA transformation protein
MFGGVGIYSDGVFFAVLDNDTLFFKVDDHLARRYREMGMPPFAPIPGAKPMSYYQVPPAVLEDPSELVRWANESIAAAKAGPRKRQAPRPRRTGRTRRTRRTRRT